MLNCTVNPCFALIERRMFKGMTDEIWAQMTVQEQLDYYDELYYMQLTEGTAGFEKFQYDRTTKAPDEE